MDKEKLRQVKKVRDLAKSLGLKISDENINKPWGAYFVVDQSKLNDFIGIYFNEVKEDLLVGDSSLHPKYLLVAPSTRLSWQYHFRRSELWRVVEGPVGVVRSDYDNQPEPKMFYRGEMVEIECGERHRLTGGDNWGLVAEIWKHTDDRNPSNEEDIVRLEDDFDRKTEEIK